MSPLPLCHAINATEIFLTKTTLNLFDYSISVQDVQDQIQRLQEFVQSTREPEKTLKGLLDLYGADLSHDVLIEEYLKPMIPLVAPWIALGGLALAILIPFCIIRCFCSKKCCKPSKALSEYSSTVSMPRFSRSWIFISLLTPFVHLVQCNVVMAIAFILLCAGSSVLSIVAIGNLGTLYDGAVGFACEAEVMENNTMAFLDELNGPIAGIESKASSLISSVEDAIQTSYGTSSALDSARAALVAFGDDTAATQLPESITIDGNKFEFSASIVTEASTTVAAIVKQMDDQIAPLIDDLDGMQSTLDKELVQSKGEVTEASAAARESISGFTAVVTSRIGPTVDSVQGILSFVGGYIDVGSYAFFAPIFLATAVGIFSLIAWCTSCKVDDNIESVLLPVSWGLTYVFMILMFFLGGSMIFASTVISDACVIVDDMPSKFDYYLGLFLPPEDASMAGDVLSGCFATPSIPVLQSFGLTSHVNFTDAFQVLDSLNVSAAFELSSLSDFNASIQGLSLETFGFTSELEQAAAKEPSTNEKAQQIKQSLQSTISKMKAGMKTCGETFDALEQNVDSLGASMEGVQNTLQPLLDEIERVRHYGECGFFPDRFDGMFGSLCVAGLKSSSQLGLLMAMIGVACIPIVVLSNMMEVRMFGRGQSAVAPSGFADDKIVAAY